MRWLEVWASDVLNSKTSSNRRPGDFSQRPESACRRPRTCPVRWGRPPRLGRSWRASAPLDVLGALHLVDADDAAGVEVVLGVGPFLQVGADTAVPGQLGGGVGALPDRAAPTRSRRAGREGIELEVVASPSPTAGRAGQVGPPGWLRAGNPTGASYSRTRQGRRNVPLSRVPSSKPNSPRACSRPVSQRALR